MFSSYQKQIQEKADFFSADNINQNFSSIVNHQYHNQSKFQQILEMISQGWQDYRNPDDLPEKDRVNQELLGQLNVDSESFNNYKQNIGKEYYKYQNNKEFQENDTNVPNGTDLGKSLMECYNMLPPNFLEQDYQFNFKMLTKDREQSNDTQEQLAEYLDNVDVNLFYQIQGRFREILSVILGFDTMKTSIDNCLLKISTIKQHNRHLKQNMIEEGKKIAKKKNTILNLEKAINLMQLLKTVHKTIPTINELVEGGKYQYAVDLLKNSENTYHQHKFAKLTSLEKYKDSIFTARKKLEQNIFQKFQTFTLDYVINGLNYTKSDMQSLQGQSDESIIHNQSSILDSSNLNISQYIEEQKMLQLPFKLGACERNSQKEESIARIVIQSFNLFEFSARNYRAKLQNYLKDFHGQFMTDLKLFFVEYLDQEQMQKLKNVQIQQENIQNREFNEDDYDEDGNLKPNLQENQQEMEQFIKIDYSKFEIEDLALKIPLELFIKTVVFYVDIMKRTVKQQLNLNNTVIQHLILYVQQMINTYPDYGEDVSQFTKINEIIDEFYQIILRMIGLFNEKICQLVTMKDMKDCGELSIFKKVTKVFQNWEDFIDTDVQNLMVVNIKGQDKFHKKLQKMLNQHNDTQFKKISLSNWNIQRISLERTFITSFHKLQTQLLKEDLEKDRWAATDIKFEFYQIFSDILDQEHTTRKKSQDYDDHAENTEVTLNTERLVEDDEGYTGREFLEDAVKGESNNSNKTQIKIFKKELIINGQKYKVTSAFLGFVHKIQTYVKMAYQYLKNQSRTDTLNLLLNLIRFYQEKAFELIVDGKAAKYKILKRITSKNLAISVLCLEIISLHILPTISQQILKDYPQEKNLIENLKRAENEYTGHIKSIFSTISQILIDLLGGQCDDMQQKLNWNSQNEKINCPTKQTAQILENMRTMYLAIEDFFMKEQLKRIFERVIEEMINIYLPVFDSVKVESRLAAKRIKDELEYVQQEIANLEFITLIQDELCNKFEFEITKIIDEKCLTYLAEHQNQ